MSDYLIQEALAFANKKHMSQTRKDGTPYIFHPIRVALLVKEAGFDERYQAAALLHDVLEDTDATIEEVGAFGEDILDAVIRLSKNYSKGVPAYFEGILASPMAKAIKTADRTDNLRDARNSGSEKFMLKYLRESKEYFEGKFSDDLDAEIRKFEEYVKNTITGEEA